jgi:deaminated glutathione amidase
MTARTLPVALVQMRTGRDIETNVAFIRDKVREAAAGGARYVQTPENTTIMDEDKARLVANTPPEERSAALAAFRDLARAHKIWLHIGSMPVAAGNGKLANRAFVIAPDGGIAARYDKIHLFDVDLEGGESHRESRTIEAGSRAVIVSLPEALIGVTICYDLRFPQLYRALAKGGARILTVPAAFTKRTGELHWQTLLRARAIENGAFVLAAAQGGRHENGRETYGHSLVIGPNGEVIAEAGIEPCLLTAHIDLGKVDDYRGKIPSLTHDRAFAGPSIEPAAAHNEAAE